MGADGPQRAAAWGAASAENGRRQRTPAAMPTSAAQASHVEYVRRQPELTAQHQIVREHWPAFERFVRGANEGRGLPAFVGKAFRAYVDCGQLSRGFIRVRCDGCGNDQFVAFSCKRRGICPSCDGKRMTEGAAHLVDSVLPPVAYRQWVLTVPFGLRYLLAWNSELRTAVLNAFLRAVESFYRRGAKLDGYANGHCGAISVLQRFDSSLRCAPHWHVLFGDGVWIPRKDGTPWFLPAVPLREGDVAVVLADAERRIWRQVERLGWTDRDDDPLRDRDPASCPPPNTWRRDQGSAAGQTFGGRLPVWPQRPSPTPPTPRRRGPTAQFSTVFLFTPTPEWASWPVRNSRNCAAIC